MQCYKRNYPRPQFVMAGNDAHIYLFIGQSNMAGRAAMEASDRIPVKNAYLFDPDNNWLEAAAPFNRFSSGNPSEAAKSRLNPTFTFLQRVTEANPDIIFGVVVNAVGGTTIAQWAPNAAPVNSNLTVNLFNAAVERCKAAMNHGTLRGIIWHQGERDATDPDYANKLAALVTNFRIELGSPGSPLNVPFIAGETFYALGATNRRIVNEQIAKAKTDSIIANYDYITSIGTDAYDTTTHFDTYSQRLLGYRYAEKINKMVYGHAIDETPPSVPTGLRIVSQGASNVSLAWDAATGNVETIGYEIFQYPEVLQNKAVASVDGTTCTITGLSPGTYEFAVRAFDKAGNISEKSQRLTVQI